MKTLRNHNRNPFLILLLFAAGMVLAGWTHFAPRAPDNLALLGAQETVAEHPTRLGEDAIERELDRLEAVLEQHEEMLDQAMESFEEQLENWEDSTEEHLERSWREKRAERREEALETDVEALEEMADRLEDQTGESLDRYDDTLGDWEERLEEQLERGDLVTMEDVSRVEAELNTFLDGWKSEMEKNLANLRGELDRLKKRYH